MVTASFMIFVIILYTVFFMRKKREIAKQADRYERIIDNDNMIIESLVQWTILGQENKSVSDILIKMGYRKVGIYGYGHLGKALEHELEICNIEIACLIDKKVTCSGKKIYRPFEKFPNMDAIIVTSAYYYEEIEKDLMDRKDNFKIISIDDILYQM